MSIEAAFIVPHPPLIIPAVGHGREAEIQQTIDAYDEVARRIAALEPELVIVTSPHAPAYRDWFHVSPGTRASGDLSQFRACDTRLTVDYDTEFVSTLCAEAENQEFPGGDGWRARCRARPRNVHPAVVYRQVLHRLPCSAHRSFGIRQHQALPVWPAHQRMRRKAGPQGSLRRERRPLPHARRRRPLWLHARRARIRRANHGCHGNGRLHALPHVRGQLPG